MKVLLEELHKVQERFGYLPESELERIACDYDIPRAELFGIVTFYSRFYLIPVRKFIIRVCKSMSCGINRADDIREAIENYLEVTDGKSKDGLFQLETVECLGQCAHGPVMSINDEVYGELTPEKAIQVIISYQREAGGENGGT